MIGFDDAPFHRDHRGDVMIVGAVYAGSRLDGILSAKVRRDGANATRAIADVVLHSRFFAQIHAILLQGIAFAGFNVVDLHGLRDSLDRPVIVVARRRPDLTAICRALLDHVPGGARKWKLIERAGSPEPCGGLYVQRAGITLQATAQLLEGCTVHGRIPEPLRTAHLIAGGIILGQSAGRV